MVIHMLSDVPIIIIIVIFMNWICFTKSKITATLSSPLFTVSVIEGFYATSILFKFNIRNL